MQPAHKHLNDNCIQIVQYLYYGAVRESVVFIIKKTNNSLLQCETILAVHK